MISYCVFFFKQKTAYERRISDWSSDVCSSDLAPPSPDGIRAGTACRDLHSHTRMRTNRLGRSAPCRRILAHDRNSNPPHMTPSSRPSDRRASGNPATQANINQTVKQQREQKRQEKLAEYQRQLAKRRRGKIVWWVVGSTAAVAIVALVTLIFGENAGAAAWAPMPWILPCALLTMVIGRSEEHTSELQSLMRISYAVCCLKKQHT